MSSQAFIGQIIHCLVPNKLEILENGYIIIDSDGKISSIGDISNFEIAKKLLGISIKETTNLTKTQLLLPGLIDTHIHAPQYPNAGLGYDKPLLDWLDEYTYKLEKEYKDQNLSENVYNAIVRKTLDYGTTTACYFGSLFSDSTIILAKAAQKYRQRALIGKVNMIRLAPDDYIETPEQSITNTLQFIDQVQKLNDPLIKAVITPRFALSCDMDHMKNLGKIAKQYDLHVQTHISENLDEVKEVEKLYGGMSYASVYDEAELLTPKTVLAHGIYLGDEELKLLQARQTSISHCPESNSNLMSGLCDVRRLNSFGITVGLGTDVAGGASPSIISAMKSAITTSVSVSFGKEGYTPLTYVDVFYMATLGGAKALALDSQIGNFVAGKCFDAIVIDLDSKGSSADFLLPCNPQELLQKFVFLGDDRNVIKAFVNGNSVK